MIPTTAPISTEALALHHLTLAIRDSASWKAWLGVSTADEASQNIFIRRAPADPVMRPFALVDIGQLNHPHLAGGAVQVLDDSGMIGLLIEAETQPIHTGTENTGRAYYWFLDQVGAVMADVRKRSGTAGYLNIVRLLTEGPIRSDEAEEAVGGDYWQIIYQVEWR